MKGFFTFQSYNILQQPKAGLISRFFGKAKNRLKKGKTYWLVWCFWQEASLYTVKEIFGWLTFILIKMTVKCPISRLLIEVKNIHQLCWSIFSTEHLLLKDMKGYPIIPWFHLSWVTIPSHKDAISIHRRCLEWHQLSFFFVSRIVLHWHTRHI